MTFLKERGDMGHWTMGCNQGSGFPLRLNIFLEVSGPFILHTKS